MTDSRDRRRYLTELGRPSSAVPQIRRISSQINKIPIRAILLPYNGSHHNFADRGTRKSLTLLRTAGKQLNLIREFALAVVYATSVTGLSCIPALKRCFETGMRLFRAPTTNDFT
ncbi:hypothetical protein NE237_006351 [Protea cynaroides]|uniref:Uncharacterized protein n=1 Tax=Protea cynaroides TaxID=273540 RepID=A0A9Q0KM72_9MAGN|nr:hypothetical protein NE237_006351 [Protea cynaroides]